jgi:tetratricopeptide (TPR) repeat protein
VLFRLPIVLFVLAACVQASLPEARRAAARGDWKAAEAASRAAMRAQPASEAAAVLHAQALLHLGQPFDAALELEEFLKRRPKSVEAGKLYAALLMDVVADRKKAETVLLDCAKLAPADAAVQEGLGKLYLGTNREKEAVRHLRAAVRLKPSSALYAAELARALEESGQAAAAEREYARALRLNKVKPDALVYLTCAEARLRAKDYKGSAELYTQALGLDPHAASAYLGRGLAHEGLGDMARAEVDGLAALREAPDRKDAHQLLLRVYRELGDEAKLAKQAEALQKLVEAEQAELSQGRDMRAALNKAEPLVKAGRFAEAIPHYEQVVRASPSFYEAYLALGICYQQTGRLADAEKALRRYLEFQPVSPDGHAALGMALLAAGRVEEAEPELERALELNPEAEEVRSALAGVRAGGPDAWLARATAAAGRGDRAKALQFCEEGLKAHPKDGSLEEFHASLLMRCARTQACKLKAVEMLKGNPSSAAYLKAVTGMLIDTVAIDPATADMARRTRAALPSDPEAQYLYAKWAYATNDYEATLAEAGRVIGMAGAGAGTKARALVLIGLAREKLGQAQEAEEAFREAVASNRLAAPPEPQVGLPLVEFLVKAGREAEAGAVVDEMLTWSPDYAPARLRRAVAFENRGEAEKAIADAQAVVRQVDEDPVVLRGAHALLARTYAALGRTAEAKVHEDWIVSQR